MKIKIFLQSRYSSDLNLLSVLSRNDVYSKTYFDFFSNFFFKFFLIKKYSVIRIGDKNRCHSEIGGGERGNSGGGGLTY